MSLFDNIPGFGKRKPSKVGLPRSVNLEEFTKPVAPAPVPAREAAAPEAAAPEAAPAPAPEAAPAPAPEAAAPAPESAPAPAPETPPMHEKVEGYDRVEDVPLAAKTGISAAAAATTAAAASRPAAPTPAKPPGTPSPGTTVKTSSTVVSLGGERKRLRSRTPAKVAAPAAAAAAVKPKRERRKLAITEGFRDPVRRPRFIIWTLVALLGLAAVMIVALGVTSTRWFCSEACHKVQDDTIIAYERSSHSEISCMACHMPVGANPIVFILHKAEALGELYLTVRNDYELPLNKESHVALTMESRQCTQCHNTELRTVTASEGILIDHAVHTENEVSCTICHNRIAHREDFELTLTDPSTGEPNRPHEEFSSMTACFRCHTQDKAVASLTAPGECLTCHPEDFELKPASHLEPDFFPEGHGELGKEAAAKVASATAGEGQGEGEDQSKADVPGLGAEIAGASEHEESLGLSLPTVGSINECYTCHAEKFCNDCHGAPMPHPSGFKETHGEYGRENPEACVQCHGPANRFCDDCHHSTSLERSYDKTRTWLEQHDDAVEDLGASVCLDCHDPTYCAKCHVSGVTE